MAVLLLGGAAAIGAPLDGAGALTLEPPPVPVHPQGSSGGFWRLTFSDEFDGPELDASNWSHGPFYALLNLQVGLRGSPQPTDATKLPAFQLVDYVRIWDRPFDFLTPY